MTFGVNRLALWLVKFIKKMIMLISSLFHILCNYNPPLKQRGVKNT